MDHSKYWPLLEAYTAALETESKDDDIPACKAILDFYSDMADDTSCMRIVSPALTLGEIYEERGLFLDAKKCYTLLYESAVRLYELTGTDSGLPYLRKLVDHYAFVEPVVYALAYEPADVPYFGSVGEPEVGTYSGLCGVYDGTLTSAAMFYVEFDTEMMEPYAYRLPKEEGYVVEVAWNIAERHLGIDVFLDIAAGKYDEYIIENLKWLGTVTGGTPLLRFAAEVNNWGVNSEYAEAGTLDDFKQAYIDAFRRISDLRREYAPNTAMVYAPTETSNLNVTVTDFYPGDDYVDFVGMSSYGNMSEANGNWGSYTDAYYSHGKYSGQMAKIRHIVDAFGDRKPIIISECGFCHESTKSTQTMEHAAEKMRYFYSYVNMVYPQVKAVFHFNTNYGGNNYMLFDTGMIPACDNSALYAELMKSNGGFASVIEGGTPQGYTRATTLSEIRDTLDLAVHAYYPGGGEMRVSYALDGVTVAETAAAPYGTSIGKELLTVGEHLLKVDTVTDTMSFSYTYRVRVDSDGRITVGVIPGDVDLNGYANLSDVARLMQYIAKWDVSVELDAADVNGDGAVNLSDVARLMKHVAKWDVPPPYIPEV